jgi:hypothetical protein
MIVKASVMRPPAPSPCTPRKRISWVMSCDAPAASEPIRNVTIAKRSTGRRP